MTGKFKIFDAGTAKLCRGINVVEASAGTGKTYAIAMLVLRFVVEHDVPVEKILVVSYTRAATEELRSRIRSRITDARDILKEIDNQDSGKVSHEEHDPALIQYCMALDDVARAHARARLANALLDMDRAAIFTIHSFCQRMLQEQALESGQLFDMELTADIRQFRDELVCDYWRETLYDLSTFHCSLFLNHFPDPEALYQSVKAVGMEDAVEPASRESMGQSLEQVDAALEKMCSWWDAHSPVLEHTFREALEKGMFKKALSGCFDDWWQQCEEFFAGRTHTLPSHLSWLGREGLLEELNGTRLRGLAKKQAFLEAFTLADGIIDAFLAAQKRAVLSLRIHLALELQTGLQQRLAKQGRMSFDDLVLSLAKALQESETKELQTLLSRRFQVALIDEFQDTDAAQYRIFSTLFGGREKEHYLYLIGDPKQAIYKFRGADIYAYFQARKSADFHWGLKKNYRSNPQLVAAVNTLFMQRTDAFVRQELPYVQVGAAKSPKYLQFLQQGQPRAGMVYCSLESPHEDGVKPWTSGKCRERIVHYVLREIQKLLCESSILVEGNDADAGLPAKSVGAGDIAILVRSHSQAEEFQRALANVSIPCVLSSKGTVFQSGECAELLQVLRAVATPADIRLLRTAMSCKWFAMTGQQFLQETSEPSLMDGWIQRFYEYHALWQEKGFLTMINALFTRESVFRSLSGLPLAERAITNLTHLTELVQEVEIRENVSPAQLLQYLASQMESDGKSEYAELRLESDEDAVKIVTMHAVKGLEYPIVFCPCLWQRSARLEKEKNCISFHDESLRQVADLGTSDFEQRKEVALAEELAEEVRLLYVAVTRASARCYVFWADVAARGKVAPSLDSAFSWLLSLAECKGIEAQTERISRLCDTTSVEMRRVVAETERLDKRFYQAMEKTELSCRSSTRLPLQAEWLMTSYSALVGFGQTGHIFPGVLSKKQEKEKGKVYELPFGAALGNVVHALLEDYPFSKLAGNDDYEEECRMQSRRFGVEAKSDQLMNLLRDVTRAPLTGSHAQDQFSLRDLAEEDVLKEMPFYFHLREASTTRINEILKGEDVVQSIREQQLKGYLTGFMDLVCRYRGRYYIMDYKTNHLGDSLDDYSADALTVAMHDHNYGLQYWIYTLVLHRYLRTNLSKYTYEEDFGGVFYLFARGMSPHHPGNGVFFDRPDKAILDELHRSLGAG